MAIGTAGCYPTVRGRVTVRPWHRPFDRRDSHGPTWPTSAAAMRAEVTEHQLVERECGCGQRTRAAAPPGAEAPACYGPRAAAVIIYLYIGQFLSKNRTAKALAELFGVPVSLCRAAIGSPGHSCISARLSWAEYLAGGRAVRRRRCGAGDS
jgi:hypothetical protein